ncbi:hypothetical protein I4X03_007415, partial [Massilia sp. R798]|nr:hypothetical protein [Massilia soli]
MHRPFFYVTVNVGMRFHHQRVVPAKAGIHIERRSERTVSLLIVLGMGSRFRGNDVLATSASYPR